MPLANPRNPTRFTPAGTTTAASVSDDDSPLWRVPAAGVVAPPHHVVVFTPPPPPPKGRPPTVRPPAPLCFPLSSLGYSPCPAHHPPPTHHYSTLPSLTAAAGFLCSLRSAGSPPFPSPNRLSASWERGGGERRTRIHQRRALPPPPSTPSRPPPGRPAGGRVRPPHEDADGVVGGCRRPRRGAGCGGRWLASDGAAGWHRPRRRGRCRHSGRQSRCPPLPPTTMTTVPPPLLLPHRTTAIGGAEAAATTAADGAPMYATAAATPTLPQRPQLTQKSPQASAQETVRTPPLHPPPPPNGSPQTSSPLVVDPRGNPPNPPNPPCSTPRYHPRHRRGGWGLGA